MVAGMVMPLADLRAIYELLFRDGVIVAKKDKCPHSMHPDVKGVTNLKVIRAMGSLKSKGCVRETFAWKHAYYYLTNEGIAYLRDYLHLPPEIVPAPLQRVRRPASTTRVHTVKGPPSYIPKPKPGRGSQETMMDRYIYRHKRSEESEQSERPPKNFRGTYQFDASLGQPGVQTQTFFKRDKDFCRGEEHWAKKGNRKSFRVSCLPTDDRATRCSDSFKEAKLAISSVPSSLNVPEFSKEMPTVHMGPCAQVREVVKLTAAHSIEAFEDSECVKMQEPTEELTRRETSNLALDVPGEELPEAEPGEYAMVDHQTEMSDPDHDSATCPSTATEKVVDDDNVDIENTHKVTEKDIHIKISKISTSAAFTADCPSLVVPSECPVVVLKTNLHQGDQSFLTEDPEEEQDDQRVWPDFLEGLSLP
ncbi:uncharacterized protein LOC144467370 [Epinephelus lanceolatus]